jgi:hypothetical protein
MRDDRFSDALAIVSAFLRDTPGITKQEAERAIKVFGRYERPVVQPAPLRVVTRMGRRVEGDGGE